MNKLTAVIMAAGKGTRLLPLTSTLPKPLLKIVGRTPLEYNLDNLRGVSDEIVIVVGYLKNEIIKYIGNEYKGIKVKYVHQKDPEGTGQALFLAGKVVANKNIIVINGDDIYSKSLINKTLMAQNVIIGKKEKNWQNFGVLQTRSGSVLDHIEEKPKSFVGDLINIGLYKLDKEIFAYYKKIKRSVRGEYEVTDMISAYAKDHPVKIVSCTSGWSALSYPWNSLDFAEDKLQDLKSEVKGIIEKGVTVKGNIHLGINSRIKTGAYLEGNFYIGENCEIGPNCYIRGYGSFDNGSKVGNAVEITRTIIGRDTNIKHLSYLGDSIIGNGVNIGAGTKVANLRHDGRNVLVKVNNKLIDTGRKKFGVIIGDGVKTGINTLLYPGTKLESNSYTYPGEIVKYEVTPRI